MDESAVIFGNAGAAVVGKIYVTLKLVPDLVRIAAPNLFVTNKARQYKLDLTPKRGSLSVEISIAGRAEIPDTSLPLQRIEYPTGLSC
ncbi:MAG: hypothetical protein ABL984_17965 [Pyrinomonadaceae bacterium]